MKSLTHVVSESVSLGAYLLFVCGVDILFNRTTAWTILYGVAGLLLHYRPRLALSGLGLAYFVTRGIFGLGVAAPAYMSAQLLICMAFALANGLVSPRAAHEVRSGVALGPYLRLALLLMAVAFAVFCMLMRVQIVKPVGWMAFVLLIWLTLPKAPHETPIALRSIVIKGVAGTISLLTTLALLELGTRLFLNVPRYQSETTGPHPASITTLVPKTSDRWTTPVSPGISKSYTIAISSQGLRDRFFLPKRPNEFRIAMLGDSFTWGAVLEVDETIPKRLEKRLGEQFPECDISVVNAGVGGYAPWQERIFLNERTLTGIRYRS